MLPLGAVVTTMVCAAPANVPVIEVVLPEILVPRVQVKMPHLPVTLPRGISLGRCIGMRLIMCGGEISVGQAVTSVAGLIEFFGTSEDFWCAFAADAVEVGRLPWGDTAVRRLEPGNAGTLRGLLTSDAAFDWDEEVPPNTRYEYRVFFHKGETRVAVDLSIARRMARSMKDGRVVGEVSFESCRELFEQALAGCFPDR